MLDHGGGAKVESVMCAHPAGEKAVCFKVFADWRAGLWQEKDGS